MTRESKLALIIGITLILLVGVLLSDHLSGATEAQFDAPAETAGLIDRPVVGLPGAGDPIETLAPAPQPERLAQARPFEQPVQQAPGFTGDPAPVVISQGPVPETTLAQAPGRGMLDETLERLNRSAETAIDRFVMAEAPTLIASGLFVPVESGTATVPPRDARVSPVKPVAEPDPAPPVVQERRAEAAPSAVHTVVEGDNLYRIALRHLGDGDRWPELQRLNADVLGGGSALKVGMKIRLGPGAKAPAAAVKQAEAAPATRRYVVLKGDMLSAISQKLLGTTKRMNEIVELNGLKDPNDIRVGQTLKIPAR